MRTPWGDVDELRERKLKPGPGLSAEARRRNQRERLYGATVAATASKGYAAVRVSDLLALSGVSRATFYQHFADKGECFGATIQALLRGGLAEVRSALAGAQSCGQRTGAALERLGRPA